MAKDMNVPFLGRVPLDPRIAKLSDEGRSYLEEYPDSPTTQALKNIITHVLDACSVLQSTSQISK
jgi:hypothetical protein